MSPHGAGPPASGPRHRKNTPAPDTTVSRATSTGFPGLAPSSRRQPWVRTPISPLKGSAACRPRRTSARAGSATLPAPQRHGRRRRAARAPTRKDTTPMRDDPVVTAQVTRAANGEEQAWDALVERYAPLIWSICRSHRLADADAGEVGQRIWRQLVDHLEHGPGSGRAPRVAGHHDQPGMRTGPARGARSPRGRPCARRPGHPGPSRPGGRAAAARRGAPCRAARGTRPPAPLLPAADHPAHPGPAPAIRHDQRHAEHPRRQHRAGPPPLPGQAPPRPGHHSTDQRPQPTTREVSCPASGTNVGTSSQWLLGDDRVRTSFPQGTSPADGSALGWRARRPARTSPCYDHELPAAHDTRAPPAAAHHPAVHPLPAEPGRVLGQPQRRPDGAPPLVPVLLPGPRPGLP